MTTLPHFPAAELEAIYRGRIHGFLADHCRGDIAARLAIRFCHYALTGLYAPWAGFRGVLEEVQVAVAKGESPGPFLIFGLYSPVSIPVNDDTAIRDWPGVQYLRYDVNDTDLLAAIKACIAGSVEPLLSHLQPNPQELLQLLSKVRHLFENRTITICDRLEHLEKAVNGEPFSRNQAQLPPVFTEDQQGMLDRLKGYSPVALAFLPESEGLAPLKVLLQKFREQWLHVAQLVQMVPAGGKEAAKRAMKTMQEMQVTIEQTIDIIQSSEQVLKGE